MISLDDPVRHGAQRYPHLVMQLEIGSAGGDSEIALHLSAEDIAAGKYEGLGADGTAKVSACIPAALHDIEASLLGVAIAV